MWRCFSCYSFFFLIGLFRFSVLYTIAVRFCLMLAGGSMIQTIIMCVINKNKVLRAENILIYEGKHNINSIHKSDHETCRYITELFIPLNLL